MRGFGDWAFLMVMGTILLATGFFLLAEGVLWLTAVAGFAHGCALLCFWGALKLGWRIFYDE